jgi:hypothetical protein
MMVRKKTKLPIILEESVVPAAKTARNRRRRLRRRAKLVALNEQFGEMNIGRSGSSIGYKTETREKGLGGVLQERLADELGLAGTHDGAVWLAKVLDPCHPEGAVLGVPDAVSCNVVSPQYTTVDPVLFPASFNPALDWNFVEFVDFSTGKIFRMSYQGSIGEVDFNAIYLTSTLPGAQEVFAGAGYGSSRLTYAGATYDFSGPTVNDQGRMVACQLTPEWKTLGLADPFSGENQYNYWPVGNPLAGTASPAGLATFLKNLAETDPKSFSDAAKIGAYFPVRNNNPFRFKDHRFGAVLGDGQELRVLFNPFFVAINGFTGDPASIPVAQQTLLALGEPWDMCATVLWVTGIDPKASYQRTVRYGFEVTIEPDSPFRPYAHVSPGFDRRALEAQTDVGTSLSSAYPADFNGLGKLWNKIKNFVGGAARTVKKAFNFAKPIYKAVAPVVGLPSLPF